MTASRTAYQTIAELREFAGFTAQEQFFIERSLEIARGQVRPADEALPAEEAPEAAVVSCRRMQQQGYAELAALRGAFGAEQPLAALDTFFAALVRVTAVDLARGAISSFPAYRFLYERLLGAGVRPYLPAAFCAAAALPQIEPARRRLLLESVSEAVIATPGWSEREPVFIPCRLLEEPDCGR